MKFGDLRKTIKRGELNSITPKTLELLGERYLEKYPKPNFFGNHDQQDKARMLVDFANQNPEATSEQCCRKLMEVMLQLKNANGWLAEKTTDLLNKGLNTNVERTYVIPGPNPQVRERSLGEIVGDFGAQLKKYTQTHGTELSSYQTTSLLQQQNGRDTSLNRSFEY